MEYPLSKKKNRVWIQFSQIDEDVCCSNLKLQKINDMEG